MSATPGSYDFLDRGSAPGRSGATERVHHVLREAIVSLDLRPGTALDKPAIAAKLGVSRFPVGEAMNRLAAEGLVEIVPQSGSRVTLIRLADARENMFLRRAIEVAAVRALAEAAGADLIEALLQNLHYQAAAIESGDEAGFHGFDLGFHALLLDTLGFDRVRRAADTARLGLERVRRLLNSRRRQEDSLADHRRIAGELERRNGDGAARAMEHHLDSVMAELEVFAGQRPELFADLNSGTVAA